MQQEARRTWPSTASVYCCADGEMSAGADGRILDTAVPPFQPKHVQSSAFDSAESAQRAVRIDGPIIASDVTNRKFRKSAIFPQVSCDRSWSCSAP